MRSFRFFVATTLLCAACSNAIAADSPLPAGKPAGAKEAALVGAPIVVLLALSAFIAGAVIATNNAGKTTSATGTHA